MNLLDRLLTGAVYNRPICSIDGDAGESGSEPVDDLENPIVALNRQAEEDTSDDNEEENKDDKGNEKPAALSQADLDRIAKAEERAEEARQEMTFLRGQLAILTEQGKDKGKESPKEEPLFTMPDDAELAKALENSDTAVGALKSLLGGMAEKVEKRLKAVQEGSQAELSKRDSQATFQVAYNSDIQEAREEFGESLTKDEDFIKDGNVELERLIKIRGGKTYLPGDFYAAAAKVYRKWEKDGRLSQWQAKNGNQEKISTNGNGARPSLREVSRKVTQSDSMGNGNGSSRESNGGPVKSLAEMGLSREEERAARYVMKKLKVSEADWIRNYNAAKREDPSYGN